LGNRPAAGKSGDERLEFSETWHVGHAAGIAARDCGPADRRLCSLQFLAYSHRQQTLRWTGHLFAKVLACLAIDHSTKIHLTDGQDLIVDQRPDDN
jgi:hypothetical protein